MKPAHTFLQRLLLLVAAVTLPWLVALGWDIDAQRRTAESRLLNNVQRRSQLLAQEVDGTLQRSSRLLEFLSARPEINQADVHGCQALMSGLLRIDPALANAVLAAADGRVLCASVTSPQMPATLADALGFRKALASDAPLLGKVRPGPVLGRLVMPMARAVRGADGRRIGVLLLTLDLQTWSEGWSRYAATPGSTLLLQDSDGVVVGRYPEPATWIGRQLTMPLQPVRDGLPEGVGVSDAADGVRRFYAVTPLADWGLTVLAGIPQDAVLGPARRDALRAALGLLALAVAVLWLAWRLSRRLVAPLGHLAATARAVAGGQASMRADESLPGEFHTVATEFNRMLDSRDHAERLVRRLSGFLGALSRTQRAIIHRAPRDELLREACAACVEAGQARIASAWLREGAELQAVAWAGPAEALFGPMPAHRPVHGEAGLEDTLTGRALAEGLWAISNDLLADTRAGEWRERAEAAGVRAQAVFPLRCAGEIVGVLLLHVDEVGWFDDALADLLHQLTDDLAFALDNLLRENARVQAQRQSVADHRRFKSIFEASPMAIAVHSLDDGRLLDLNPVFAQQLGRPREALIGCLPSELGLGSPIDNPLELMQLLRRDGHLADHEVRLPGPDGGERVVLFSGELVDYGGQTALLTIGHDITARRDAERALRARESQLSGIVESAMDAIITIDAEHRVVMFNRAASDLMGVPASAVLGRPLDDFVPPDLRERHRQGLARFIAEGRSQVAIGHRGALFGARANGERFPFEAAVSRQGEGAQMTMTAVIRDLTERLAAEAAREARIVAEAASQAKTEFLSRMSHELRTPLNAMLGFAQLLADDPQERLSTRQARQLALVREAGWHLLALIDDVLDVSRIEAGQLELRLEAVPLRSLIDSALSVSAGLAARHQVQLLPPPPTLPASLAVRADATRLRQVVLNLLSNGCKYNRPGGTVAVEVHENGEAGNLRIDVVDSGVGMRPEQVAHLFEPFNRLGREDGPVEGTGLGLHLTRQLVSMMGGSISAHSVQGEGTRMCVRLPRATGVPAALALPAPPPDRGGAWPPHDVLLSGSVLYVEDNPVNLLLVEQFMLRWPDVRLASASNGSAGLERLRSERFDLVLLDMQLPDMHGTEVLHSLRAERLQAGTPVVALSASAMPQAVEAALAAGAAEYWTKPLDLSRLAADLQRFLRP